MSVNGGLKGMTRSSMNADQIERAEGRERFVDVFGDGQISFPKLLFTLDQPGDVLAKSTHRGLNCFNT